MMNRFYKLLRILPLLMTPGMTHAISIGFNPASQSVTTGDTIMTDIVISDLGIGVSPSISTYDLDVTFNGSHLSFVSTSFGNQLDLFGLGSITSDILTGVGVLNLFELSFDLPADLDALQADNFTLATITFDVVTTNSSALGIVVNALGDSLGNPLAADVAAGNITSTDSMGSIPEPAVTFLFLTGLAAFGLTPWSKKS